jgi:hypothetical protein
VGQEERRCRLSYRVNYCVVPFFAVGSIEEFDSKSSEDYSNASGDIVGFACVRVKRRNV